MFPILDNVEFPWVLFLCLLVKQRKKDIANAIDLSRIHFSDHETMAPCGVYGCSYIHCFLSTSTSTWIHCFNFTQTNSEKVYWAKDSTSAEKVYNSEYTKLLPWQTNTNPTQSRHKSVTIDCIYLLGHVQKTCFVALANVKVSCSTFKSFSFRCVYYLGHNFFLMTNFTFTDKKILVLLCCTTLFLNVLAYTSKSLSLHGKKSLILLCLVILEVLERAGKTLYCTTWNFEVCRHHKACFCTQANR